MLFFLKGVNIMNDFLLLKSKFNYIKSLGWIRSLRSGSTGVGYTFGNLLRKDEDFFYS